MHRPSDPGSGSDERLMRKVDQLIENLQTPDERDRNLRLRSRASVLACLGCLFMALVAPTWLSITGLLMIAALGFFTIGRSLPQWCAVCQRWPNTLPVSSVIDAPPTVIWWKLWPERRGEVWACKRHWQGMFIARHEAATLGPLEDRDEHEIRESPDV